MTRRGLGWKPDELDARDWTAGIEFGLSSVVPPDEATLEHHVQEVYDQGATNSCVGQALCAAIEISESVAGLEPTRPSALFAYYNGRRALLPKAPMVFDTGSRPRDVIKAAQRLGICDNQHWPFDRLLWRKNRRPSFNAMIQAHGRAGGEYAKIKSYADTRLREIRQAVAAGYPVIVSFRISADWQMFNGPDTIEAPELATPLIGGHMVTIVGYDKSDRFRILNSWSEAWRDGGFAWIDAAYIASGYCSDLYVIRGWKRIRAAYEKRQAESQA